MKLEESTTYKVAIFHLIDGIHDYDFEFKNDFFASFDYQNIKKGNVKLQLRLEKNEHLIVANFDFEGSLELTCDRTVELFDHPITHQNELLFRYGDSEKELSDNAIQIMKTTEHIDVAQWAYEFIILGLPIKKLHPKFRDEQDDDSEFRLIYSSQDLTDEDSEKKKDSPWDILTKLKRKKF